MRWNRPCRPADGGFSLAEVLVAIALVSIALLALLGALLTSAASVQAQQVRTKGIRVALDLNEKLRLAAYDASELSLGTHAGTATAPDGSPFSYSTVVSERDARTDDVAGDIVKEIRTTVSWTGPRQGSVLYTTAVAANARDVGLPTGYTQSIRSMSITPDPSTVVDYDGYTSDPVVVTAVLTGYDVGDVVRIGWTDDAGTRTGTATTTDARYWRLTIPAGSSGLRLVVAQNQSKNLVFTATTATGIIKTSTLTVFGPTIAPPKISSFTLTPSPVDMINGGGSRYQNKNDVTFSCVVTLLDPAVTNDSVKASYIGEIGQTVQVNLIRSSATSSSSTWTTVFPRSTTYFGIGVNQPYSCVVRRYLDGGTDSKLTLVTVKR